MVSAELEDLAFSLKEGSMSGVFSGPGGYYIIKVEEVRQGREISLDETYERVKQGLIANKYEQSIQDLLNKLKEKVKIRINEKSLL